MTPSPLAQADLFDDADEDHGPSLRQAWAHQTPPKRRRLTRAFDLEGAAQILDEHDDYRVLRRLKPRPVDPAYRLAPGESIALVVDVETTGLDHRRDEVIELGMALGRISGSSTRLPIAIWAKVPSRTIANRSDPQRAHRSSCQLGNSTIKI